jgi:hypothetical protein
MIFAAFDESGTRAAQPADTPRMRGAEGHPNATLFVVVIAPAGGTRAAIARRGDFGKSAFFGQLSDKPLLARTR